MKPLSRNLARRGAMNAAAITGQFMESLKDKTLQYIEVGITELFCIAFFQS